MLMFGKSRKKRILNLIIFFAIFLPDVVHDVVVVKFEIVAFEPKSR